MCKQEEEMSERLVAERLESNEMLEVAEDRGGTQNLAQTRKGK